MNIIFPDWYDDVFEFECESKGCILDLTLQVNNAEYTHSFYDIHRFIQEAQDEISERGFFQEINVVILKKVNKDNILKFFSELLKYNKPKMEYTCKTRAM